LPEIIKTYVRTVEATNRVVGKFAMYLIFAMMGILLFSSISRSVFDLNFIWIVEMAQFTMASYYILGGGYSIILKGHVRMDLLYGKWTEKGRAIADVLTSFFLIFYLVLLLYGAISSTQYALEYGQKNYSSLGPPMAPIKIIMTIGIVLMLLQAVAVLFRDIATSMGEEIA